jgi:hypothetical protein
VIIACHGSVMKKREEKRREEIVKGVETCLMEK